MEIHKRINQSRTAETYAHHHCSAIALRLCILYMEHTCIFSESDPTAAPVPRRYHPALFCYSPGTNSPRRSQIGNPIPKSGQYRSPKKCLSETVLTQKVKGRNRGERPNLFVDEVLFRISEPAGQTVATPVTLRGI
jgi:hypothetical protein